MKTLSVGLLLHALVPAFWAHILAKGYANLTPGSFYRMAFAKNFAVMLLYFGLSLALILLAAKLAAARTDLEHGGAFVVLAGVILVATYSTLYLVLSAYNVVGQLPATGAQTRKWMTRFCLGAAMLILVGSAAFPSVQP